MLGGSRARGTARAHSDTDIGLYYRRGDEPAAARLREALRSLVDDPAAAVVTEVGEWGPRIVGGAWLSIGGKKVDLLYRCVEVVEGVVRACRGGDVRMDYPLHDPDGALAALRAMTDPYPDPLRHAFHELRLIERELKALTAGESLS